jgi:hypothetical protein
MLETPFWILHWQWGEVFPFQGTGSHDLERWNSYQLPELQVFMVFKCVCLKRQVSRTSGGILEFLDFEKQVTEMKSANIWC